MKLSKKVLIFLAILIFLLCTNNYMSKAATVKITTETLNLREKATTESDIIALLSEGEEYEVVGEEGDWYEIQYKDYTGFVSKEYVQLDGKLQQNNNDSETDQNNNTGTEGTEQTNSEQGNGGSGQGNEAQEATDSEGNTTETSEITENTVITAKTTSETQMRITPLIQSSIIDIIPNNTDVTVINQINGWAYIQTDIISGWVRIDNLNIQKQDNNTKEDDKTDEKDNKDNETDKDNEKNNDDNDTNTNFTEKTMYTTDVVNIRKEPNTKADVLMVVEQNTSLKVVGESGDWYEVETSKGNAYVSKEYLSEKRVSVTNRGEANRIDREEINNKEDSKKEESTQTGSTNNTSKATQVVSYAKEFLGVPYVYGGASPSGFDCSGFTMYVFDKFGIDMVHGARSQSNIGKEVNANKSSKSSLLNSLKAGDLVFFLDYETMDRIGHCGIYIGEGNFIHASSGSGYCVKIDSLLPGEYYNTRYCAARRVL